MAGLLHTINLLTSEHLNILLIKQTSLGDVLHSTAQVRGIRERFPDCRLTMLTSTTAHDIYRHNPNIDRIILFDRYWVKRSWWRQPVSILRHVIETFQEVRRESYDLALDLQGRWKSVIFLWGARSSKRFAKGRWWFTQSFYQPQLHALDEMNGLLESAGLGRGGNQTEFFTSADDQNSVSQKMSSHKLEGQRWILCCPISRWPTKDWPLKNYVELARGLPDDVMLVFTGSEENRKAIRLAVACLPDYRAVNLAGELSLAEFSELVNLAPVVLTGDSFSLHVAAANGRPVVALFGPTDERRVGPISNTTVIVRAENANCERCYRRAHCSKRCIRKIHLGQVNQALKEVAGQLFLIAPDSSRG